MLENEEAPFMTVSKNSTDFYKLFINKDTAEIGQFHVYVQITELDSDGSLTNRTISVEATIIDTERLSQEIIDELLEKVNKNDEDKE